MHTALLKLHAVGGGGGGGIPSIVNTMFVHVHAEYVYVAIMV